jgi:primase-polymerase (primpol)-like protein
MPDEIPTAEAIPDALSSRDQWVCWRIQSRGDSKTKVPINPESGKFASTSKPKTWSSFDQARESATDNDSLGVGFVFTTEDQIVGVDLDDCRDPESGEPDDQASEIIDQLDSYTEVSPSGTGYHVLVLGSIPTQRNRRENIEVYESGRFFTVTGQHVEDTPTTLSPASDALADVYEEHIDPPETSNVSSSTAATAGHTPSPESTVGSETNSQSVESTQSSSESVSLSDDTLLEKAMGAANGQKFRTLWEGQTSGYDSQSEADMALCSLLAFWTGGDSTQIDRLFRRSGLMREKWDTVHFADGSTYGEKTIERAIANCSTYYDPHASSTSEPVASSPAAGTISDDETTASDVDDESAIADASAVTPSTDMGISASTVGTQTGDLADHVDRLIDELESARKRIEQLESKLESEQSRRRELETKLEEQQSGRWWWPFG